jgi:hypothetical protein
LSHGFSASSVSVGSVKGSSISIWQGRNKSCVWCEQRLHEMRQQYSCYPWHNNQLHSSVASYITSQNAAETHTKATVDGVLPFTTCQVINPLCYKRMSAHVSNIATRGSE